MTGYLPALAGGSHSSRPVHLKSTTPVLGDRDRGWSCPREDGDSCVLASGGLREPLTCAWCAEERGWARVAWGETGTRGVAPSALPPGHPTHAQPGQAFEKGLGEDSSPARGSGQR